FPVQGDGVQQRCIVKRHEALLPSEAQHEHIRGDGIAEQRGCDAGSIKEAYAVPGGLTDRLLDALRMERKIGIMSEVAWKNFRRVDDKSCLVAADGGEHSLRAGDNKVATEHQIGFAGRDPDRVNILRSCANLDMAINGAAFLREASHVDRATALAFKMRGHPQNSAYGDDAGAAHPGHEDPIGFGAAHRDLWPCEIREILLVLDFGLPWAGAMHSHQGR